MQVGRLKISIQLILGPILLLAVTACSSPFESAPQQLVTDSEIAPIPVDTPASELNPDLLLCSPLDFKGISWSPNLSLPSRRALALGLTISGGFEGTSGWANISNDFDGMGLSAGLLNQTLGTGSLQPLLAQLDFDHPTEFAAAFSPSHYRSIKNMLEAWKQGTAWRPHQRELVLVSDVDRDSSEIEARTTTPTDQSVQWARQNLYQANGDFISSWKAELQNLIAKPSYISLQIEAAKQYHDRALEYLSRIQIHDLRTYLLMFDVVTQNGGIKESRFTEWEQKVRAQKLTTSTAKLKALVDIRLQDTKPQWRSDVKKRKYTIIDGIGRVHGMDLNLPKMFCYSPADSVL